MEEYGKQPTGRQKYPLKPIVDRWRRVFASARKDRKKKFDVYADEAMNFYDGPTNHYWKEMKSQGKGEHDGFLAQEIQMPQFEMSVNRLFEAVSMFGPVLYHQNPVIAVTPRVLPDVSIETFYAANPQALQVIDQTQAVQSGMVNDPYVVQTLQQLHQFYSQSVEQDRKAEIVDSDHALILEKISNYIQQEGSKQDEARNAITEAIITGLGLLEISMEQPPGGGPKMARSRYRTNKDLLIDPDATYWRDVTWIALKSCQPVNVVEEKFGLPPGSLKGKYAKLSASDSAPRAGKRNGDGSYAGVSHDLIEYWEVYSKNGLGQNLKLQEKEKDLRGLDVLGDFCYLAICESCPYPLNLSPDVLNSGDQQLIMDKVSWEVPYWDDYWSDGGWPIVRLTFYNKPGEVWPVSLVKPCIGLLKFTNWCMSFIADKVAAGSKIYVGVMKEAGESIRSQLTSGSGPFSVVELERISGKSLNEVMSFLQAPNFSIDIWNMVAQTQQQIDKALGLTELMYGMSGRQMRSAAEAQYRQQNINIRPDDMASRVEDWLSLSAVREIQAMRFSASPEDVAPIVGDTAARVFAEQILTDEVSRITRDFTYRVEAGTARKPNRDSQIAQLTDIGQYILPVIQQAMMSGVTRPYNAYMNALGRAMDMEVEPFLLGEQEQQMLMQMNAPPQAYEQEEQPSE